jgi:hypothetical protein
LLPEFRISLDVLLLLLILTPLWLVESDVELDALKAMVENAVALFYPDDPSTSPRAPQLLDVLSTQSQVVILTNMK